MENYFSVDIKPRFRDTDSLGHVNNAVYLTYLEFARTEWFLDIFPIDVIEDFNFIIARAEMDYILPVFLKSNITVKMWVSRVGNKSWDFSYTIEDSENGSIHARAKTVQVVFDYKENKTIKINNELLGYLHKIQNLDA